MTYLQKLLVGAAAAVVGLSANAGAAVFYQADLTPINGVGSGSANLELDGNMLTVNIMASGLDTGTHLAHIHGLFTPSGQPKNSALPTIAADTDGDGFIELAEALPDYGPIILNMNEISAGSTINFTQTFDLTDPDVFGFIDGDSSLGKYTIEDLIGSSGMNLQLREIIVHGQNAPAVGAGTDGEVDGTAGFKLLLPALGGEIEPGGNGVSPVPEPASWALMISGFALVGASLRTRRHHTVSVGL